MKIRQKAGIFVAWLIVLFGAGDAFAFYNPSTGRWLSRDPINEPGFKVSNSSRKTFDRVEERNLYLFVVNRPINAVDAFGLAIPKEAEDCYVVHPLYPDDPACNKYGERKYLGASLKCFCKFPLLRDTWSNYVRGCLA
jgi:RHS repeat-associated protein